MAQSTLGIKLYFKPMVTSGNVGFDAFATKYNFTVDETKGILIPNVMEIGELGVKGSASAGYDKIEVTTLSDDKHKYINGLKADASDSNSELGIKMLYDPVVFDSIAAFMLNLEDQYSRNEISDNRIKLTVEIPSTQSFSAGSASKGEFTITGTHSALSLDGIAVNSAMTMSWNVAVSGISFDAPDLT